MQLKDFGATLLRRWYLVLFVVACAAAAALVVVNVVGPTYRAQAAVILLPPGTTVQQASVTGTPSNPLLSLNGVSQARDVVIRTLMASSTREELCKPQSDPGYEQMRGQLCKSRPGVTYEVTPDFTSSAPIIVLTVDADSTANAIAALEAVTERVPLALADLQKNLNLRSKALIMSMPVVVDTKPELVYKRQIRAGIVAAAGALGLGLLLIGLLDGLSAGRRDRLARGGPEAEEEAAAGGIDEVPQEWGDEVASDWGWGQSEAQPEDDEAEPAPVTQLHKKDASATDWADAMAARR